MRFRKRFPAWPGRGYSKRISKTQRVRQVEKGGVGESPLQRSRDESKTYNDLPRRNRDRQRVLLAGLSDCECKDVNGEAIVDDAGDCGVKGHSAGRGADDRGPDYDDADGHATQGRACETGRRGWSRR